MNTTTEALKILLHAPTAASLARARSHAANLLKQDAPPEVRIVLNAEGVAAALDQPDAGTDTLTLLCPNTLRKLGRTSREPLQVLDEGAVVAIARMQAQGWCYIRA
jgi:intracellular sulfur oxidation DsrE/DsrF family protein